MLVLSKFLLYGGQVFMIGATNEQAGHLMVNLSRIKEKIIKCQNTIFAIICYYNDTKIRDEWWLNYVLKI